MILKTYYGLPRKVIFCKKTLISNQRPNSSLEFFSKSKDKKKTLNIDKNNISDTWKYSRIKKKIDFKKREKKLLELLDLHRGKYGKYDCIVPGSGGKDSCYAAHILKTKYGMSPLLVCWKPILRTDYGKKNFENWIASGDFDIVNSNWDRKTMNLLTKLSIKNLLHPFQTFILGQKNFAPKIAAKYNIPLIFYGENEAEHGNSLKDNYNPKRSIKYFSYDNLGSIFLGGVSYKELINSYNLKKKNLDYFLPVNKKEILEKNIEVHYLGYYLKWIPQEVYYYAVENCGFRPRPFRTIGTYSKYNSIDDKIDDLHYYTTFIKFGIGRATYDVSQELRNDHLTIEEGKNLIKKYDGEFPNIYLDETLENLNLKKNKFLELCDKARSPHLWKKKNNNWYLRHTANNDGTDD